MTDLLVGLAFTIGTFFILLLLYFVYIFQDKRTGIKARLYKYAIIINAVLILSELVSSYLLYDELMPKFGEHLLKFHWYTGIAYFYMFYFYSDSHLRNIDDITLKEYFWKRKEGKIITIITVIATIVYCFIPFKDLDYHALSYLPGMPAYFVFAYAVIIVIITFFKYIRKKNKTRNEKFFIVLFVMVPTIDLGLQLIWLTVAFSPTLMAFLLMGCYFLLENPDLYVTNELEESKKQLENDTTHKKIGTINKARYVIDDLYNITNTIYNNVNNNDKESYKKMIKDNIYALIDSIYDLENSFNILSLSNDSSVQEDEYSTETLLTKLYTYSTYKANNKNLKISFDIDQFLPISLFGDSIIVYQLLLFTLNQAIKNTDIGKIILKLKCNFSNDSVYLNIEISDTGNGISKDKVDLINNLNDNTNNNPELEVYNVSKKYVSLLKGNYNISSVSNVGTVVSISFSQKIINQAKIGEFKPTIIDYKLNLSNKKILIVDNNPEDLILILKKYNIKYEAVKSFTECINKLKIDDSFDTVFVDSNIGNKGENIAKTIKSLLANKPIKVIGISPNYIYENRKMLYSQDYDYIVYRPYNKFDMNDILKKI